MIQLQNISVAFGGQPVLRNLSWTVPAERQRIGLIGPNGAGKSTLLRVISGQQEPDEGTASMPRTTTIGYLEQDAQELDTERSVVREAMMAFGEVTRLQADEQRITRELDDADDHESDFYQKLLHELSEVQSRLVAKEAHRIRPQTEAVLSGLGFEADELERPVRTFSGGWRMRVALAKLLLRRPDYLLLDEPTNHLDIESIDWLEDYLKSYDGTVIIVSHDRYFLDRMVTTIAEMARGKITEYAGNYSYYLEARKERRAQQQSAYENQQKEIAQIERFIERFRYKAHKAKLVQSRIKYLEKLDRIEPPPSEEATVTIRFPEPERSGRVVMEISDFSKHYDASEGRIQVFEDAGPLTVERGDKIALIGKNGAGKSTLARILRGIEPFDGAREVGYNVDLTFFAQHQAESLDPEKTVLESVRELAPRRDETDLRTMLGAFLFTGDDVFKTVRVLSGGEKSRVALARTLLHPANFLILDEPTNHLDIQSIDVLTEALKQYSGSFVIVSHDRHFLDEVANTIWHVGGGRVRTFPGTYSEYRWHVQHGSLSELEDKKPDAVEPKEGQEDPAATGGPKSKEQKRREAEERNRRYREMQETGRMDYSLLNAHKLQRLYEKTETTILEKEERLAALEDRLGNPSLYEDGEEAKAVKLEYDELQQELEDLYATWEEVAEHVAARADD